MGLLVNSVVLASVYALIAVGWVVIFRASRIPNFASGSIILVGALIFTSFVGDGSGSILLPLVLALAATGALAALIHRGLLTPLTGERLWAPTVLLFGLSILLGALASLFWGNQPRVLPQPVANSTYELPMGASITTYGLLSIVVTSVVIAGLLAFFRWSRTGTQMRAVAESGLLASQTGIRINHVTTLSWVIAGCTSALAGIQYGYVNIVGQEMSVLGLRGIAPALIGGFDSVKGVAIGSLIVAAVETYGVRYLGGESQDAVVFVVLLAFLVVKPYGLFGTAQIRRV
ncbi:MAG: branched-chain amino acid ABC transporter permease [Acidimicrobiia bacterium]